MVQYKETLVDLNQIIQQTPDDIGAITQRGNIYCEMRRYQEAVADFSRVIALKPDYAWAIAHRAEVYCQMEQYQEAVADFGRAIELKPDYAWAIAHRAEVYCQMECYEKALADFDIAIKLKPDNALALAHRGVIYELMDCCQEAVADFNRAIELKPDYAWAFVHRGTTYIAMGQYKEALDEFSKAKEHDETILNSWPGERGLVLNFLGQYDDTIACCQDTWQDDPIAGYSFVIAKTFGEGLDKAQATIAKTWTHLESVVEIAMNSKARACALYRLGGLAALMGKRDEALNYLEEAISLDNQPVKIARHDPVWHDLWIEPRFQALISRPLKARAENCN